jgi:low affinity Fe/Cu permease
MSMHKHKLFGSAAAGVARAAGRPITFTIAILFVVIWLASGPIFGFTDTWQLIINTTTTIITFLMVFLLQNSQNRDNAAIQVKLDELIRVSTVQNRFVGIENLTEEELEEIRQKCEARAKRDDDGEPADDEAATEDTVQAIGRKARRAAESV